MHTPPTPTPAPTDAHAIAHTHSYTRHRIYTHAQTHAHALAHALRAHASAHAYTSAHACVQAFTRGRSHFRARAWMHVCTRKRRRKRRRRRKWMHMHAWQRIDACTHTCTLMHAPGTRGRQQATAGTRRCLSNFAARTHKHPQATCSRVNLHALALVHTHARMHARTPAYSHARCFPQAHTHIARHVTAASNTPHRQITMSQWLLCRITCVCTRVHTHNTHTHTHHTHTHTSRAHARTHARTQARTHTHTNALHTRTCHESVSAQHHWQAMHSNRAHDDSQLPLLMLMMSVLRTESNIKAEAPPLSPGTRAVARCC